MRSKTSFFNGTIFKKNITRFWPVWVIYSIFCFWTMPIYAYMNLRNSANYVGAKEIEKGFIKVEQALNSFQISMEPWVIFGFAIISAVAVFSYLYNSRSANMIHALPVRREELYVTNYLSGLTFMLVPQLVTFLLTVFVWFGNGVTRLGYLMQWLGIVVGETIFAYSMGVFCVMLTGSLVAAPFYYVILNYLYKAVQSVWNILCRNLVYGFIGSTQDTFGAGLIPMEYLRENIRIVYPIEPEPKFPTIEGMGCLWWYLLAAVAFTVLAQVIYKKRQIECAGEVVAISWIKPVARWAGAVLCAGLTGELFQEMLVSEKALYGEAFFPMLICWVLGGMVSFFAIEMVIEKRFRIFKKRILIEAGVFAIGIGTFLGCMEIDLFGLEDKMPDAENVSELYVKGSYERYITGKEQIQDNIELQKKITASQDEYQQYFKKYYGKEECNYMTLEMLYITKDGKRQIWRYDLPTEEYFLESEDSAVRELIRQESNPEDYMVHYFTEKYADIEIQSGSFADWVDEDYTIQSEELSQEESRQIVEAVKKDIYSGNYKLYPYGSKKREETTYVNTLSICYQPPKGAHLLWYGYTNEESISEGIYEEYSGIILTKDCKYTIALLEELGIINEERRLVTEKEFNAAIGEEIVIE